MKYIAFRDEDYSLWDYICGDIYSKQKKFEGIYKNGEYGKSIVVNRYSYLYELNEMNNGLKISFRDIEKNKWTKRRDFPELMYYDNYNDWGSCSSSITPIIDVHRSMLSNEVVIESDYPTYEENWDASIVIGKILEEKGFSPIYYYSGGKSIHIHIFFDWNVMCVYDDLIMEQLKTFFNGSKLRFKKKFIKWLREKMISCWGTKIKKFDTDLMNETHYIRAELSKNKKGFKTFMGYSYKDLNMFPPVCNEKNKLYPKLAEIKLSIPNDPYSLMEEFIESLKVETKKEKLIRKNYSLNKWFGGEKQLRNCVKIIYNESFAKYNDGIKRGMFILVNELRKTFGDEKAKDMIYSWNEKMGDKISKSEIDYRLKNKIYNLSCKYIHNFLKEFGIKLGNDCNRKIYKV
jgi:hypothetical protein